MFVTISVSVLAACSSSSNDGESSSPIHDGGVSASSDARTDGSPDVDAEAPLPTTPFLVTMWCGPPVDKLTQATVDEAAQAGFTVMASSCDGVTTVPASQSLLQYAEKDGLSAIVSDPRISAAVGGTDLATNLDGVVTDYGSYKALAGYFVGDEPSAPSFSNIAAVVSGFETRDPKRVAYTNLLPNYASAGQLGTATYDDYVNQFLTTVKPALVSWDYYPFNSDGTDATTFFADMEVVRARAVGAKVPFFQFIQSISYAAHRATNEAEKLWEGMQTLAYGGAGISYFTYWTPSASSEAFGDGIIAFDGTETSQYAEVTRINAKLAAIGKYTAAAQSMSIFHNGALAGGTSARPAFASVYFANTSAFTVGTFSVNGRDEYVLIANRDYNNVTESDAYFAPTASAPESLDVTIDKFVPMTELGTSTLGIKVHIKLDPADAILVHLRGPVPDGAPGAEAYVGTVRADQGTFDVVDSAFGDATLGSKGWADPCPDNYVSGGKDFESNGFFLCVRKDLVAHTLYVGNVVADAGTLWAATGGTALNQGVAGWDTCPKGKELGRRFESNGFWICLD